MNTYFWVWFACLFTHTTCLNALVSKWKKWLPHLPPWDNQPFSVTYNLSPLLTLALLHAMCICTIYSHCLGKKCCLNVPPISGKISTACVVTRGSTDGENNFLHRDHGESRQIMLLISQRSRSLWSRLQSLLMALAAKHQWFTIWTSARTGRFSL